MTADAGLAEAALVEGFRVLQSLASADEDDRGPAATRFLRE